MSKAGMRTSAALFAACAIWLLLGGCQSARIARKECPTPTSQGLNVRDMVDTAAQDEYEAQLDLPELAVVAEKLRTKAVADAKAKRTKDAPWREKNILCLSGGGSFGAFSAGVLCGWTCQGTRPEFDVVTGISTGALIAPFAFLGPAYDGAMKDFFTKIGRASCRERV